MANLFDLIVITRPDLFDGEAYFLDQLLAAGVARLHIRKPGVPEAAIETLLQQLPSGWSGRLVLHGHPTLALRYGIPQVHISGRVLPISGRALPVPGKALPERGLFGGQDRMDTRLKRSVSLHSWEEAGQLLRMSREYKKGVSDGDASKFGESGDHEPKNRETGGTGADSRELETCGSDGRGSGGGEPAGRGVDGDGPEGLGFEYVFISPLFDSISKPGYSAVPGLIQRPPGYEGIRAIGLGGVSMDTIGLLLRHCWNGAAVLGWLWEDPKHVVSRYQALCRCVEERGGIVRTG